LMILLQIIFTYVPFMQGVFSTAGLSASNWVTVVMTGAIVLIVTEIHKYWRLRKSSSSGSFKSTSD